MPRHTLIFGAASTIAEQAARALAARGHHLTLAGRDCSRLDDIAADLANRGAPAVRVHEFDAGETDPEPLLDAAGGETPVTDVLIAHALPQPGDWPGREGLARYFRVNTVSAIDCMHAAAEYLARQGGGGIAWLSSPAALRGRRKNWLYGASKAAGDIALEGIAGSYREQGVHTLCVRPGPTRTRFNAGLEPSPAWADPAGVGRRLGQLIHRRATGERYIPRPWWIPAMVLREIPTAVLTRLKG